MDDEIDASARLLFKVETGKDWTAAGEEERRVWRTKAREMRACIERRRPTHPAPRMQQ